jgi:hypothetical protein
MVSGMINTEKIGEFLVRIDAMTEDQRSDVLKRQEQGDARLFGEIAVAQGYVEKSAIRKYFHLR